MTPNKVSNGVYLYKAPFTQAHNYFKKDNSQTILLSARMMRTILASAPKKNLMARLPGVLFSIYNESNQH